MKYKWVPLAAGILEILLGLSGCIVGYFVIVGWGFSGGSDPILTVNTAVIVVLLSVLAIAGGILTIKRKLWLLTFAGAIASCAPTIPYTLIFWSDFSSGWRLSIDTLLGLSWMIALIPTILVLFAKNQFKNY